jgi:hypothetical protein
LHGELGVAGVAEGGDAGRRASAVPVKVVRRMSSGVMKGRSSSLTTMRWPRWFSIQGASAGWKWRASST